ncbi:putative mitochondrial phenylalanyl-tRNA synthetase alpha chain [Leptomonas pyrrhocoris]|uniref:phenylalanine--tRNA ligase n=1 Tax=Leptomonas pyrrhocoris TaxID=157538 RepID=A0A0N0DYZ8_LEPPY|nr:putative mitochondrial phenylalanyl-tRNA synthetase alpha chain [Leptomonas pyrrhocoris]KPA84602.1 putative mitochondrial phenylalanyl-tRNA synthetase alpha chain [Leptomonas pyrrhocoris]|eukprot:XP_015663041.1 putative mitochondrial phenylalanyl-tRNA synthetase alpha chain [Leptomonas pyrrhocoris]
MSQASVEAAILKALSTADEVQSTQLAKQLHTDHQVVVGAAKSLESDNYIKSEMGQQMVLKLSHEAHEIIEAGSPEYLVWEFLKDGRKSQEEVTSKLGKETTGVALANGIKAKMFKTSKEGGKVFLERVPGSDSVVDAVREVLKKAAAAADQIDAKTIEMLKKRKLATVEAYKTFTYTKGPSYAKERTAKAVGDLTRDILMDGSWKERQFKEYNFSAQGAEVDGGALHPLLKVRQEFREILMELGFQEMDTQHWAEVSFWNFDSLIIPQQHPARDLQDTFFLSKPESAQLQELDYVERVKTMHEACFRTPWKMEEATRNVLRTHTTGSSAFVLHNLAKHATRGEDGKLHFRPGRYYSIDRVFRNEEMDRTHLCEFHQVEGFVIDRDISLAKMMHTFDSFFRRIGVSQLRFKPAFNPYTEPSMEIFGFHTGLNKWIEVGNSGLFRPELLRPMGFDDDVSVMAWGLSLERPTMIKYGINNIHELFGHRVDVRFIKRAVIARY